MQMRFSMLRHKMCRYQEPRQGVNSHVRLVVANERKSTDRPLNTHLLVVIFFTNHAMVIDFDESKPLTPGILRILL